MQMCYSILIYYLKITGRPQVKILGEKSYKMKKRISKLSFIYCYMPISCSHHVEIEREAPVVGSPEVMAKHQPGSAATAINGPRCGTRRHVCFFFLYFTAVGIRRGLLKLISCISESAYIYIYILSLVTLLGTPVQFLGNTNC